MTPAQLIRLCEEIYTPERGKNWKRQAARDLGIAIRSFHRMLEGTKIIPATIRGELKDIRALYVERRAKFAERKAAAEALEKIT